MMDMVINSFIPNWDCVTSDYVIRVENSNMTSDSGKVPIE